MKWRQILFLVITLFFKCLGLCLPWRLILLKCLWKCSFSALKVSLFMVPDVSISHARDYASAFSWSLYLLHKFTLVYLQGLVSHAHVHLCVLARICVLSKCGVHACVLDVTLCYRCWFPCFLLEYLYDMFMLEQSLDIVYLWYHTFVIHYTNYIKIFIHIH